MDASAYECKRSRLGLSQLGCWRDRHRTPFQDGDHSGNDPRLVLGFLRRHSGLFPERFQRMSVSVGSREIRLIWTEHPRCGTMSSWIPGIVSLVTLPSISSKTFAIYSSMIPGADEFCDWMFLGYSCVSLDIAANFSLFLKVAIFGKRFNSGEDWIILHFYRQVLSSTKNVIFPFVKEHSFQSSTVNWVR